MKWYLKVVRDNYANFKGRATRQEYWMFVLFNLIFSYSLSILGYFTGLAILSSIYSLAILLPSIAVAVRRLHDTGKSGWYYAGFIVLVLIAAIAGGVSVARAGKVDIDPANPYELLMNEAFLPYLGIIGLTAILYLFIMVQPSQEGTNQYGPNPDDPDQDELEATLYE